MNTSDLELVIDESKRDRIGRRTHPLEERKRLALASDTSAMSLRDFARHEGVNYHTLVSWRRQFCQKRKGSTKTPTQNVSFAECSFPMGFGLEVQLPDGTLLRGERAESLALLAKALKC